MKNILIIVQNLYGGGAERVAADVATGLSGKYNVLLVTFDSTADSYEYSGKRICLNLISNKIMMKPLVAIRRIVAVKRIKRNNSIDCSISFLANANLVNVMSGRKHGKNVVSIRNNIEKAMGRMAYRIEKCVCQKSDMMVALSKGVELDVAAEFQLSPNKVQTIYNMCNVDNILKVKEDQKEDFDRYDLEEDILCELMDKYCIITCGSMRRQKGQWHLLKAFKLVHEQYPETRLVILGDGKLKQPLKKLAKELCIENCVYMLGFIRNPHLLMKKLGKLFCFSSLYEGFGNVILEAMACELPVVSYDCKHGPREIICGEICNETRKEIEVCNAGILVPLFDEENMDFTTQMSLNDINLSKGIKLVLENKELAQKLIGNGVQRVKDFSGETIVHQWEMLIEQLTN